jgi:hypothetical protein
MLYRKAAPNPPRLLLRIAATAGAGALLGAVACSSTSSGSVAAPPTDSGDQGDVDMSGSSSSGGSGSMPIVTGVLPSPHPDAAGCGGGPCGVMVRPPDDAGDASDLAPDAVSDAEIAPDDVAHCGGVCGVIVHLDQ